MPQAQDYYIIADNGRSGPFDVVMLVRKIRNGTITPDTMLTPDSGTPAKPAFQWPELKDFFTEKKPGEEEVKQVDYLHRRSLSSALEGGGRFLQRNQISTILGGAWVLVVILMMWVAHFAEPSWVRAMAYIVCFIFSYLLLSGYLFSILRMVRGQPAGLEYLLGKIYPSFEALFFSSTYISIVAAIGLIVFTNATSWQSAIIGLLIFAIPGFIIFTLYAFTPFIIIDQGCGFWKAMEMSRKAVLKSGIENIGVLYALFVINFLAGLFVIMPMAITLPITMSALAEIYDDSF